MCAFRVAFWSPFITLATFICYPMFLFNVKFKWLLWIVLKITIITNILKYMVFLFRVLGNIACHPPFHHISNKLCRTAIPALLIQFIHIYQYILFCASYNSWVTPTICHLGYLVSWARRGGGGALYCQKFIVQKAKLQLIFTNSPPPHTDAKFSVELDLCCGWILYEMQQLWNQVEQN